MACALADRDPAAFLPRTRPIADGPWKPARSRGTRAKADGNYRELKERHPQGFALRLAAALGNQGDILLETGRSEEAIASYREAIERLKEPFLTRPQRYRSSMQAAVDDYLQASQQSGAQPDPILIDDILQRLREDPSEPTL